MSTTVPTIPYAPSRMYDPTRQGDRIVDLILRQGDVAAQGAAASGAIWGNAVNQLGQIAGGAIQQHQEQKQQKQREQALDSVLQGWDGQDLQALYRGVAPIVGPEAGIKVVQGFAAVQASQAKQQPDPKNFGAKVRAVRALKDKMGPEWVARNWSGIGPLIAGDVKEFLGVDLEGEFTPEYAQTLDVLDDSFNAREPEKPVVVPATGRLVDPNSGNVLVDPVPETEKGPTVGSFEDYVVQKFGPRPTPEQITQARKEYGQADDRALRPIMPVVINTAQGPQLLNREEGTTSPIRDASGQNLGLAPTAEMRNKQEGRKLVSTSINAIEDLSKKILTRVGPGQRAAALARGAEAIFGNDPEFRTYQDARMALAGNLAVAQQGSRPSDADIKAIWLPLVPDPYRDTSESAAMKWTLIKQMSNVPSTSGGLDPEVQKRLDALKQRAK